MQRFNRTKLLIGEDSFNKIQKARVALFGVGGVGGFAAEALVRSGVVNLDIFDNDTVSLSNVNRQIIATQTTLNKEKVLAAKERLLDINPNANINGFSIFYLPERADIIDLSVYDYVIDAVDTVSAKLELISRAKSLGVPVISCMGTGGKRDIEKLKVTTIEKTSGCPLARVMRRELKNRGISGVKVVYSEETVKMDEACLELAEKKGKDRIAPPSMIFVPAAAGLMLAKEVIFDIIGKGEPK